MLPGDIAGDCGPGRCPLTEVFPGSSALFPELVPELFSGLCSGPGTAVGGVVWPMQNDVQPRIAKAKRMSPDLNRSVMYNLFYPLPYLLSRSPR
jgi:hypothetical protein